jgi:hypothetical protein
MTGLIRFVHGRLRREVLKSAAVLRRFGEGVVFALPRRWAVARSPLISASCRAEVGRRQVCFPRPVESISIPPGLGP